MKFILLSSTAKHSDPPLRRVSFFQSLAVFQLGRIFIISTRLPETKFLNILSKFKENSGFIDTDVGTV